jgi:hypothetical protein
MFRRNCSLFFLLVLFSFEQEYDQEHREEKENTFAQREIDVLVEHFVWAWRRRLRMRLIKLY